MKQFFTVSLILGYLGLLKAQTPDWSTSVASIIYNNCTKCHNTDGIAPFPLQSYQDAVNYSAVIPSYINSRTMPPWPPDPTYRHYVNERVLTQGQIDTINDWINGGTPEGNEALAPAPPVINNGPMLGTPDMTLQEPTYTSTATSTDDYACFVMPLNITEDKYIKAIEVLPGNPKIVHHVIVMVDSTATMTNQDCMLALANLPGQQSGVTITSWAAGMYPTIFPTGEDGLKIGERLKAGSNLLVQIHYPVGTAGQVDSTKILLYLYSDSAAADPNPPLRQASVGIYCMNWGFILTANTAQTLNATYPSTWNFNLNGATSTPTDQSLIAVDPHMHLIGRAMTSFGVTSTNDTIPFERVSNWQFNWQAYYFFRNMLKLPAGSVIYDTAFYDNTSNNPYNPNNPPQTILPGENTSNEMDLCAFMNMDYQPGDENYNMDSIINVEIASYQTTAVKEIPKSPQASFSVFPNPASGQFTLIPSNLGHGLAEVSIIDALGQTVKAIRYDDLSSPVNIDIKGQAEGLYLVQVKQGNYNAEQKLVIDNK